MKTLEQVSEKVVLHLLRQPPAKELFPRDLPLERQRSARNVVIFDGVAGFDAKERMLHLEHTNIWYKTYRVRNDAAVCLQSFPI